MKPFSPLMIRSSLAKTLGLAVGLLVFFIAPSILPDLGLALRWGILALFLTLGGFIGIVGFIQRAPLFDWVLPVWLRGFVMGAWMGLLFVLLAHDQLAAALATMTVMPGVFTSPWWFVVDLAFWGLIIDLLVSRIVGPIDWPEQGFDPA